MDVLPVILIALAFSVIILGRLYFRQNRIIYRPGPLLERSPADLHLIYEEVHLVSPAGLKVWGWWIPFKKSAKALIYFHGSDGNITHELPTIRFLHSLQINTLIVEYPGYRDDGLRPSEATCYQAAEAAWTFLVADKGFVPENIILFGHSLGSGVATYLAADRKCGGLVLLSGFTSIPDLAALAYPYLPVRLFVHTKMDSLARIGQCDCPILLLHSETDDEIPVAHAKKLFMRARSPKKLVVFSGPHTGHHWLQVREISIAWRELLRGDLESWETHELDLVYASSK